MSNNSWNNILGTSGDMVRAAQEWSMNNPGTIPPFIPPNAVVTPPASSSAVTTTRPTVSMPLPPQPMPQRYQPLTQQAIQDYHNMAVAPPNATPAQKAECAYIIRERNKQIANGTQPRILRSQNMFNVSLPFVNRAPQQPTAWNFQTQQMEPRRAPEPEFVPGINPVQSARRSDLGRDISVGLASGPRAFRVRNISNWANELAEEHAMANNWFYEGRPITWENEADALRHFVGNARMTRNFGINEARIIADENEVFTWNRVNVQGGQAIRIGHDSLMDLYNDHMGRVYAERYPDLSEIELFQKALANGDLITDSGNREHIQRIFGFRNDQIFSNNEGNSRYVLVFVNDGTRQPIQFNEDGTAQAIIFMTYEEFNKMRNNL